MKKSILFLFLSFVCLFSLADDYRPMFTDGKVWNQMLLKITDTEEFDTLYYSYFVGGDTLVMGRPCKKLMKTQDGKTVLQAVVYEEGKKVYEVYEGRLLVLLYDFGLPVGGKYSDGRYAIAKIDTVSAAGGDFRRFYSVLADSPSSDPPYACWVEGIGSYTDMFLPDNEFLMSGAPLFSSCYENGKCIFTQDDFFYKQEKPIITQIAPVSTFSEKTSSALYDLQGRRLTGMPQRGLYIQNGRKYIAR